MTIKTITTVDGINVVDFGNTINKYYWFRNLGGTTIYVSNKEDFKAGDDGVSELTAKGDITNIESLDGKVYILGAGKVEIHNTDSKLPPFNSAPVAGGGGGEVTVDEWIYTSPDDPGGLLANIMNTTGYNGGGYNISGGIQGRFGFYQSLSGYNITHSNLIDLTDVKKIKINGATVANTDGLSATAYYCISDETVTELDNRWIEIHSSTGTSVSNFSSEIDCSEIAGEKYIYLAIKHGDESSEYTSYFYVDRITLSGASTNVNYADNAGNADTLDGLHADSFALKTDIPTSLPANGGNADTVDGKHADDFIPKNLKIAPSRSYIMQQLIRNGSNDLPLIGDYLKKDPTTNITERIIRMFSHDAKLYSDLKISLDASNICAWNFTSNGNSNITKLQLNGKDVAISDDITELASVLNGNYAQSASGVATDLPVGMPYTITVPLIVTPHWQPIDTVFAILLFDSNSNKLITNGFSVSLLNNTITIVVNSAEEMGTNSIKYIVFWG